MEERKETMEDYAKELEASFRSIKEGDIITGTVIAVNEEGAILDLQYYAQGVIKAEDMSSDPNFNILEDVKTGDTIEATVVKTDDGEGNILLSKKEAVQVLAWDILKGYMDEKKSIQVKISEIVKAGAVAFVEGIRGFIPASQLSLTYVEDLEPWLGKQLEVRVITVDQEKNKLVLSAKAIEKEKAEAEINHKISMLAPGTIKKPSEVLNTGDKVKVKVLNTNDGKISLSMKAVEENTEADEMEAHQAEEYSSKEEATTSLGDLFKKLKL